MVSNWKVTSLQALFHIEQCYIMYIVSAFTYDIDVYYFVIVC